MISTADYAGTLDWYRSILGFEVQREWDVAGHPDVEVGYIAANGFMIEVVGTPAAFSIGESYAPDVFAAMSDRGYVHMAFKQCRCGCRGCGLIERGV